jgi:hypothetical protein
MSDALAGRLLLRVAQYYGCTELTLGAEQVDELCTDLRQAVVAVEGAARNAKLEAVAEAALSLANDHTPEFSVRFERLKHTVRSLDSASPSEGG